MLFSYIVAKPPSIFKKTYLKEEHFAKIRQECGFANNEILFFDDYVCFIFLLLFLFLFRFMAKKQLGNQANLVREEDLLSVVVSGGMSWDTFRLGMHAFCNGKRRVFYPNAPDSHNVKI